MFHPVTISCIPDNIRELHVRYKVNEKYNYELRNIQVDVHVPTTSNYPMDMNDRTAKSNIIDVIQGNTRPNIGFNTRARFRRDMRGRFVIGSTRMTLRDFEDRPRWLEWDD